MPCSEPSFTDSEERAHQAARSLVYLFAKLDEPVPDWIMEIAEDCYPSFDERLAPMLCEKIKQLTLLQKQKFLYDGRIPEARKLMEWWETHKEFHRSRNE